MTFDPIIFARAATLAVARDNGVPAGFETDGDGCWLVIEPQSSPTDVTLAMALGSTRTVLNAMQDLHVQCGLELSPLVAVLRRGGRDLPTADLLVPGLKELAAIRPPVAEYEAIHRMWHYAPHHDAATALLYLAGRMAGKQAPQKTWPGRESDLPDRVADQTVRVAGQVDAFLASTPAQECIARVGGLMRRGQGAAPPRSKR